MKMIVLSSYIYIIHYNTILYIRIMYIHMYIYIYIYIFIPIYNCIKYTHIIREPLDSNVCVGPRNWIFKHAWSEHSQSMHGRTR